MTDNPTEDADMANRTRATRDDTEPRDARGAAWDAVFAFYRVMGFELPRDRRPSDEELDAIAAIIDDIVRVRIWEVSV